MDITCQISTNSRKIENKFTKRDFFRFFARTILKCALENFSYILSNSNQFNFNGMLPVSLTSLDYKDDKIIHGLKQYLEQGNKAEFIKNINKTVLESHDFKFNLNFNLTTVNNKNNEGINLKEKQNDPLTIKKHDSSEINYNSPINNITPDLINRKERPSFHIKQKVTLFGN